MQFFCSGCGVAYRARQGSPAQPRRISISDCCDAVVVLIMNLCARGNTRTLTMTPLIIMFRSGEAREEHAKLRLGWADEYEGLCTNIRKLAKTYGAY